MTTCVVPGEPAAEPATARSDAPVDAAAGAKPGKGSRTRDAILDRGVALACRVGLGGLTIGSLATDAGLSKSGMYAHFGSKQALQLAVLDTASEQFAASVIVPALAIPRGEERIRALADAWIECGRNGDPGGCLFVKASAEVDEQPGPVRDRLRALYQELGRSIARMVEGGIADGTLRDDVDPAQFATDLHGVMLAYYHAHRLLSDPAAEARARTGLDALLDAARSRPPGPFARLAAYPTVAANPTVAARDHADRHDADRHDADRHDPAAPSGAPA